jgi:DNA phosphorothioation-dependent restriction protein DptG
MEQDVKIVLNWFRNNNKREGEIITAQQLLNLRTRYSIQGKIDLNKTIQELKDRGYLRENSKQQLALTDIGEREIYQY